MSLDRKVPKGYRKAWNGGTRPDDPKCPRCDSNRNVSPRSVNTMTGDSVCECSACVFTFDVASAYSGAVVAPRDAKEKPRD